MKAEAAGLSAELLTEAARTVFPPVTFFEFVAGSMADPFGHHSGRCGYEKDLS